MTKPAHEAGTQLRFEARISGQFLHMRPEDMQHEDNEAGSVGGVKWRHDSQAGRKLISITEYLLTWLYVQEPPIADWRENRKGRVNKTVFLDSPAECLLFENFGSSGIRVGGCTGRSTDASYLLPTRLQLLAEQELRCGREQRRGTGTALPTSRATLLPDEPQIIGLLVCVR